MRRKNRRRVGWFVTGVAGTWAAVAVISVATAPGPQQGMLEAGSPIHPVHLTAEQRHDMHQPVLTCVQRAARAQAAGRVGPVCKQHHWPYWLRPHIHRLHLLPWWMRNGSY